MLKSGRGQDKEPGRIRIEQNWIGVHGRPIEEAFHVPPEAHLLPQFIDNWLEYYRGESPDPLVQLAVIHAQFEILHPFMDGNGRIGRLLVPLFLYEKRILSEPVFYLSAYLEAHRDEYEQGLRVLSGLDSWNQWILFFLRAIESQAEENAAKARDIQTLYESLKRTILDLTRSQYAVPLLDAMFAKPIFRSSELFDRPEMPSQPAVTHMLNQLKEAGVLTLVREAAGRRPQVLMLEKLLSIAEGREVRLPAVAQVPA
ncbi:MAG: Fic family protein [Gammaproteobacteria bacterium]|nr:Fic family protein [Gammaproteobacteria bacterium]